MKNGLCIALMMAIVSGGSSARLEAQWVSFEEETRERLLLSAYADGSGPPRTDTSEKDIAVGDLNRDGWMDAIVVRKTPFSNPGPLQDILLINRDGVLVDRTAQSAPGFLTRLSDARDVVIADFDSDSWPDVVIANTFEQQPMFYRNRGSDLNGNWLGLVEEADRLPIIDVPRDVNTLQICAVAVGDVTGDGSLDLYLSNYKDEGGTTDLLLINDGNGFFSNETRNRLGDFANVAFGTSAEIVDMDADGDNDIVKLSALYAADPFGVGVYLLYNDGLGRFTEYPVQKLHGGLDYMFTVTDFDGDELQDLYVVQDLKDRIVRARQIVPNGPNLYRARTLQNERTKSFGGNVKTTDIDGDGDADVGVAPIDIDIANCGFSSEFALYENTGGRLIDHWDGENLNIHVDPHDFAFVDIDNDGCDDLLMGLCTGWRVFVHECEAR